MKHFVKQLVIVIGIFLLLVVLLIPFIKGQANNAGQLLFQYDHNTKVGGPLEASNSTSRYALTESLVLNHTPLLSEQLAKFSLPDVATYNGKFISLFTPGVSFIGVPFYMVGMWIKMPQLFTYFSTLLFAICNVFLIAYIVKKISNSFVSGLIGGLSFLFATNALPYSLTFTQHHFSVFVVLLSIILALRPRTMLNNILFGFVYSLGLLFDIPNAFLLMPSLFMILSKEFAFSKIQEKIKVKFNLNTVGLLIGLLPLLVVFGWYNIETSGSPAIIAQFIGRTTSLTSVQQAQPAPLPKGEVPSVTPQAIGFDFVLKTRSQLNGAYTLLVSDERAWWYYCPVVLIGLLGIYVLYKKRVTRSASILLLAIVLLNILFYSMFSDPWGGWAFGSRYLIPAAAVLCIGVGSAIARFRKNLIFAILFMLLLGYSLWVNVLGALTTASIPPEVEAIHLTTHIPWTYQYNLQLLNGNFVSSLFYTIFLAHRVGPIVYFYLLLGVIFSFFLILYIVSIFQKQEK